MKAALYTNLDREKEGNVKPGTLEVDLDCESGIPQPIQLFSQLIIQWRPSHIGIYKQRV